MNQSIGRGQDRGGNEGGTDTLVDNSDAAAGVAFVRCGFALKFLWIVAAIVLVLWLVGFLARSSGSSGRRSRWRSW
ncbi:hypothetical protein ABT299_48775 [Spirillospora sp. NPDC000708]